MATRIYKIGSEIWGPPPKIGGQKYQNFGKICNNYRTWLWISLERRELMEVTMYCILHKSVGVVCLLGEICSLLCLRGSSWQQLLMV